MAKAVYEVRDMENQNAGRPAGIPPTENNRYYPALDGMRAFAVLLVFLGHYEIGIYPRLSWGWAGVDFFFALSGFLITGILYDTQYNATRLRDFFMRRILRIFPLYFGVLLVAAALTPKYHWFWNSAWIFWFTYLGNYVGFLYLHSPIDAATIKHLVSHRPNHSLFILYTGHFWSLCVEEQFYLFWPLIVYAVGKRETLRNICSVIIGLDLAARILCSYLVPADVLGAGLLTVFTPLRLDALLLGALAALLVRGPNAERVQTIARRAVPFSALAFIAWEYLYSLLGPTHHVYAPDMMSHVLPTIGYTLIDTFSALLVLSLLRPSGLLYRTFAFQPLRWLGQISYGFYIFHDLFHIVYDGWTRHILAHTSRVPAVHITAGLAFASTLLLASLSYYLYEKPFLRLKRRFAGRVGTHALPVAGRSPELLRSS